MWTEQEGVDAVGSCVGLRGIRIQNIVNELQGEKIDIVQWNSDPKVFIANSLNPSQVLNVNLDYVKIRANDGSIYYFADDNLEFQRLEKQFKEKKQWINDVPKLKTISQIFKEKGGYEIIGKIKGA